MVDQPSVKLRMHSTPLEGVVQEMVNLLYIGVISRGMLVNDRGEYPLPVLNLVPELSKFVVLQAIDTIKLFDDELTVGVANYTPACILRAKIKTLYESAVFGSIVSSVANAFRAASQLILVATQNEYTDSSWPWISTAPSIGEELYLINELRHQRPILAVLYRERFFRQVRRGPQPIVTRERLLIRNPAPNANPSRLTDGNAELSPMVEMASSSRVTISLGSSFSALM